MTKAITAATLPERRQFAMNPASIVYPDWPRETEAQNTVKKWADDKPLFFFNPEALR